MRVGRITLEERKMTSGKFVKGRTSYQSWTFLTNQMRVPPLHSIGTSNAWILKFPLDKVWDLTPQEKAQCSM